MTDADRAAITDEAQAVLDATRTLLTEWNTGVIPSMATWMTLQQAFTQYDRTTAP